MGHLFLGLDCSTQSLSTVIIDTNSRKIVYEKQLIFERDLPHYRTKSGTLRHANPLIVHSPPLMWVEALDKLFEAMCADGVDLKRIAAISGSAQQHGSVYLNDTFLKQPLNNCRCLKEHLEGAFSRLSSPIWMDASTACECQEIREAMGGSLAVIEATGSNTLERFTGPQIRKFYKTEPEAYAKSAQIALVSSFLASIMAGKPAPIDHGDGSGMNLMDIRKREWHEGALQATAPHLLEKLPPLAPSGQVIGFVNPYFVEKYGLNSAALALVWTGDNPSSLIGLGLIEEEMSAISLGTSFTHFACLKEPRIDPKGEGHLFVSPTGDYMPMNVYQNGALAIQALREHYGLDWEGFNAALVKTPAGNQGGMMLPYFEAEIIPKILIPGLARYHLDEKEARANCRALIEAQMMSMRLHAGWMKLKPKVMYATGGVSHNKPILQIAADVHNCVVERSAVGKSTALGAALIAFHAVKPAPWKEVVKGFTDPVAHFRIEPNPEAVKVYEELLKKYAQFEKDHLKL